VERCLALARERIVLETTGGFGVGVTAALPASQLPVVVVNPRKLRDFRPRHSAIGPIPTVR
jgi:transposase